jgi:hypothetical protein
MAMNRKPFTVDVTDVIADAFSAQVDERGYTKWRAIEGAIKAFLALEPDIQTKLMSPTIKPNEIRAALVLGLVRAETIAEAEKQGLTRGELLNLVKESKARTARKG